MKKLFLFLILLATIEISAQQEVGAIQFWNNLKTHCGKSYEGIVIEAPENDGFRGNKLIIHFRFCYDDIIKIPFFVGEDKSRTWVLKLENNRIQLKHDHRHPDGTPDKVTQYGGTTTNSGMANIQYFPADQETAELISYASTNIWWVTIDKTSFTYNLRRIGTDRLFSVRFDLTKPVENPSAPWGWEN